MEGRDERRGPRGSLRLTLAAAPADPGEGGVAVGRVLGGAFACIRASPGPILLLALLFGSLPNFGLSYALAELDSASGPEADWPVVAAELVAAVFAWSLAGSLAQGVLTRAVTAPATGRPASIGECLVAAARVAPSLLGVALVTALAISFGLLLVVVPGVMLMVIWAVAVPIVVEERSTVIAALRRSALLTRGARWGILGLLLVLLALSVTVSATVEVVTGQWDNADVAALVRDPVYVTLRLITDTMLSALWAAAVAVLYIELGRWKNGASVEDLEQVFA